MRGWGARGLEGMFDRKKVGTRQRYDIQSTGSGPAPVSKSLQKKKKEEKKEQGHRDGVESLSTHIHTSRGGVRKVSVCGELA